MSRKLGNINQLNSNKTTILAILMCLLISSSLSAETPSKHLSQYSDLHNSRFNLVGLTNVIDNKNLHLDSNSIYLYLYNSVQYIQLCYDEQSQQVQQIIPIFARQRSYQPIDRNNLPIRCYNIFNKLQVMEEPLPLTDKQDVNRQQQRQNQQQQQNEQTTDNQIIPEKKKQRKETEYLNNQYQLVKWVHDIYVGVNKQLATLSSKLGKKLTLQGLQRQSINLYINEALEISITSLNVQHLPKQSQPKIPIHKSLSGQGFHQQVTYTIQIPKSKPKNNNNNSNNNKQIDINDQQCQVQIIQTLPHTTYVDVDQLRSQGISVQLENIGYGDSKNYVNVEKPAYLSKQYQYKLTIPWKKWDETQINAFQYKLPIHFRYPTPYFLPNTNQINPRTGKKMSIQYIQIDIYPIQQAHILCYPQVSTDRSKSTKYILQQNYLVSKGAALVPVGDGQMKAIVSGVTLISQIICAMLLIRQIRK